MEIYGLAMDRVPHEWREDERWRSAVGGFSPDLPAHKAQYPSRWLPVNSAYDDDGCGDDEDVKIIDYLDVPKKRPGLRRT